MYTLSRLGVHTFALRFSQFRKEGRKNKSGAQGIDREGESCCLQKNKLETLKSIEGEVFNIMFVRTSCFFKGY